MSNFFLRPNVLCFSSAIALRLSLLFYGIWQDANFSLKYTDIDYFVFTDAARLTAEGQSPYDRDTYRYTPLLAWILLPTTLSSAWFSFGKILFATGDIMAGCFIFQLLKSYNNMSSRKALAYSGLWLLNPMVAIISTRGSSEGLLGALVVALLWAALQRRVVLAGVLLGLGVHFKIYPFIYAPTIFWWLDDQNLMCQSDPIFKKNTQGITYVVRGFFNSSRLIFMVVSLFVFSSLNLLMYSSYGYSFLQHTYLYHVTRIDHRHNFSPYNILLYLSSTSSTSNIRPVTWAFLPQLFLSVIAIPLLLGKKDLPSAMFAQTFAFVSFNKVCTSQYFLWYIVFLPFYLPKSSFISNKFLGLLAAAFWGLIQVAWLRQAYLLEFLGKSTFLPGLCLNSILFFLSNSWTLGIIISDIGSGSKSQTCSSDVTKPSKKLETNIIF